MSDRFSLAAPPASGKVSRREKVSRSGRSIDLGAAGFQHEASPSSAAQQRERMQSQASSIQEEDDNPFEMAASPARRAPPAQQQAMGLQSRPPPAAAVNDDLFSFFDPLSAPAPRAPAAKPQVPVQQQQRPAAPAADPFSTAFSQQLSFDPFGSAPVAAAPAAKSPHAAAAAGKKVVKPNKVESSDSESESDSSSSDSSSDDSSDSSDSSSDSDAAPARRKKKAAATAKSAAKASAAVNQMGRGATPAASSIAQTGNRTLSVPGAASGSAAASSSHSNGASGPGASSMTVDVLALMRKGCPFLKYGKAGFPHFRQFQLSADNTRLEWFSSSKKLKDTQIQLALVDSIRLGQHTANFARHPAPDLAKSSFSLIYDHGRSTLDLIAKDPNDFLVFTRGLGELIRISQEGRPGELERLTSLHLNLGIQTSRRSSSEIVDAVTGQSAAAASSGGGGSGGARGRALSTNNKAMYREVAQSFQKLKYKLNKRREELRTQGFYMHPQYASMDQIVRRVQESVNKCTEWFQDGEYALCDDEIWRAGVDLESLKNMMKAVGAQR